VMEVDGTLLYFGSEMLNGWRNVDTTSFVHTWLMFFGLNALWLLFPGWCIYELVRHYAGERRVGLVAAGAEPSRA
jgi:thiosulfate reductase cytochrome b subunit